MTNTITRNKNIWKLAILATIVPIIVLKACAQNVDVKVQVVDQDGKPLHGVEVDSDSQGWLRENEGDLLAHQSKLTDHDGTVSILTRKKSLTERFYLKKKGYYNTRSMTFSPVMDESYPPSKPIRLKIKKIKNPIAMYAKNLTNEGAGSLKIVKLDGGAYGYDLIIGDWVHPNGLGKVSDFIFSFEGVSRRPSRNIIRDVYDQKITLVFSNEKDGITPFIGTSEEGWRYGSDFVSDYEAPRDGYQSEWISRTWMEEGESHQTTNNIDRNFYFRVRTKVDENGNIESAHYGKIYGDFMSFIYYFNPNQNDRNVEFDPNKNLIKNLDQRGKVNQP